MRPSRRLVLLAALAVVVFGGGTALSYYVESLWFGSFGLGQVFWKTLNVQTTLFGAFGLATFLILYGAFVQARGALTQIMIGDFAAPELTDAAFSIYYFVGFISGPIWTLIIGYVMQTYGFTEAFYVAAATYIAGMLLLTFVREEHRAAKHA